MNSKNCTRNRYISYLLSAVVLCCSFQTAQAQFIGGVGAPTDSPSGATDAVGAGAPGSNLGATVEPPILTPAAEAGTAGLDAGAAAVGGLSTTTALALAALAAGVLAAALSSGGGGGGTTGTK